PEDSLRTTLGAGRPVIRHPDRALPTTEEWAQACELKANGRGRWKGPCPLCGGTDRFHVEHRSGRVLVGCRGCMDGLGDAAKQQFGALLRAVFPERFGQADAAAPLPRPAPCASKPASPPPASETDSRTNATHLWVRAVAPESTPARTYLASRLAWPPDGTGPDLPSDVRWLAATDWPPPREGRPAPPRRAAGAIAFAYRRRERLVAMDLEALTGDGQRLSPRWRRTIGLKQGAVFRAGGITGDRIVLAEGPVDALACRWLHPEAECLATGGTAGLTGWSPPIDDDRSVLIEPDGDAPGRRAAIALQTLLLACGRPCRIDSRRQGDPASDLAADLTEQVSVLEANGSPCDVAVRSAWQQLDAQRGNTDTRP
ncbi:MAG: toprim domain-containing protein, partial [Gammaproteobacteria bacterium]|nr:toprim domain-containing protein [Gammaproteobacteria bacterium]